MKDAMFSTTSGNPQDESSRSGWQPADAQDICTINARLYMNTCLGSHARGQLEMIDVLPSRLINK